ncbi:Uncharacterized protein Fot_27925 [Forsythia ovata]|uniref:Uncharacterized protein n=1 Tax=Forsythia ovata TaxID=205694 RepID=A0ABD1TMP9_9LAMI
MSLSSRIQKLLPRGALAHDVWGLLAEIFILVGDEEVEAILPTAAYALAKIHMHLVSSGFCYTARGGFCYTEDDIIDFHTDNGENIDGLPTQPKALKLHVSI